ncbi:MAG: S9 family peptidase [Acidobacteria bacterium]|nr:S9 family peptidase [Acidobacteriota bacterium]
MKTRSLGHLCIVFLFLFAGTGFSQTPKRPISIDDFFKLKDVSSPQISPDGKWIAYTVSEKDLKEDKSESRIWMISTAGGEAIPMTAKGYSAGSPRWSPDGKYLSFTASRGKDKEGKSKPSQVWALNRLGGEAQELTNVKQGVSGYEWSPDSKRLALVIRDPKPEELTEDKEDDKKPKPYVIDRLQFKRDNIGYLDRFRRHLYVFTLGDEKSEPIQITSGDFDDSDPVWSPDGRSIAFVSNRSEDPDRVPDTNIWIVSPNNTDKGQTLIQVTTNPREDSNPSWSPDGQTIAYVTVTAPLKTMWYATNHLATVSARGGKPTIWTSELDRNVMKPTFSDDGKSVWFMLEDSGEQQLVSLDLASKNLNRMITGESIVSDFAVHGNIIAPLITKPDLPNEIFSFANGQVKQLTFSNKKLLDQVSISKAEDIHFNSKDGTEIEGFMYKPIGYDPGMKYPTILWNHGGPVSQYDFGFSFWAQIYAANGYLVIQTNPRGSSGYGQAFSYALYADWGNLDVQDALAGVDYAIEKGYADPDRLGVGGWSYGGILTNYLITQSTRFKGAVSGASEALFRANYGHDHYQMWWEVELGLPWENAAAWERISPFNKVDKITTPTLWIGGAADWNVPILNSEQMYQSMKRLGRETQLVVYPNEHHGIRRPTFQKDRFERFIGWYDKYVKGISKAGGKGKSR